LYIGNRSRLHRSSWELESVLWIIFGGN
jgi:hypothetical protein